MNKLARRVAARWIISSLEKGWQPPIPEWLLAKGKVGYSLDTPEGIALHEARESVVLFIPKLLSMLRQKMGERYYMNSSTEGHGKIFFFFAPKHPIDSFSLILATDHRGTSLSFGYLPYKVTGRPDFSNSIEKTMRANPETAGLALMKLVRDVLKDVSSSPLRVGSKVRVISKGSTIEVTTTVDTLAKALWGARYDLDSGYYPDTKIPLRQVPKNAEVTLVVGKPFSGSSIVRDTDGGWIADRFMGAPYHKPSSFGVRETKKALAALGIPNVRNEPR